MTEEITIRQGAAEATGAVPSAQEGITGGALRGAERKPMVSWATLLDEAVRKPGYIHEAYSRFHNYSIANQALALFQCLERGIQPGPLATFAKWKELGRHVKKGERAQTLCMPLTCKRTKAVTKDDGSEQEEEFTFTHFTYKVHWFVLSQTKGGEYPPPAIPDCSEQAALATLNPRFPIATFSYKPSGVRRHLCLCGFECGEDASEVHPPAIKMGGPSAAAGETEPALSVLVRCFFEGRFPGIASDFRWWPDSGAGVGRTSGIQRTHPATLDGLSWEEHPVAPCGCLIKDARYYWLLLAERVA